jgi:hypothetical protein
MNHPALTPKLRPAGSAGTSRTTRLTQARTKLGSHQDLHIRLPRDTAHSVAELRRRALDEVGRLPSMSLLLEWIVHRIASDPALAGELLDHLHAQRERAERGLK